IELPEDILTQPMQRQGARIHAQVFAQAGLDDAAQAHALLAQAQCPLLIVGGECRSEAFRSDLKTLVSRWQIPVVVTNKNQDQFSNTDPLWAGQLGFFASPAHSALFSRADLLIAIGSRMGDVSSLGF